jgi:uncharacterized protein
MQVAAFIAVSFTMVEMFTIPRNYFVLGSIVSTTVMICAAYMMSATGADAFETGYWRVALGITFALVLYAIFFLGNYAIKNFNFGVMHASNESDIYGLFSGIPTPVLVLVLALDSVGFESYFRGNLQRLLTPRLGIGSVFAVAALDAVIHVSTLNPLFPVTVIFSDTVWGFNYYLTKDLYSNYASHFLWDLMIFVLLPIH